MYVPANGLRITDASEIAPHAIAFARMMFAHAAFEGEVRSLVDVLKPEEPSFGERPENQWMASASGTAKIIVLIMRHRGSALPQIEQIRSLWTKLFIFAGSAIALLMAHGGVSTAGP